METIGAVFESRERALDAVETLGKAGVAASRIDLLTPGIDAKEFAERAHLDGAQSPGAWGAVGAGIGSFAGAAIVSVVVPGIGPVLGLGALAAGWLAGAFGGKVIGDAVAKSTGDDDTRDDLFLFYDALRREKSLLVVMLGYGDDPAAIENILRASGGVSFDEAREEWWRVHRADAVTEYQAATGRTFDQNEAAFRRGFEAGCDPRYSGRNFEAVALKLRPLYDDDDYDAFRAGFERAAQMTWERQAEVTREGWADSKNAQPPMSARRTSHP